MVELRKRKTPPPAAEKATKKKSAAPAKGSGANTKAPKAAKGKAAAAAPAAEPVEETLPDAPPADAPAEAPAETKVDDVETHADANGAEAAPAESAAPAALKPSGGVPAAGATIDLEGFGGEVETNDGAKTTLKQLVEQSKAGVVLFTYPKASTPGCTTQVCLFRDAYIPLTATGLAIYGLSTDTPKANTTFKTKQNLPYPLLCDPKAVLIKAIGMHKPPKSTKRGVFVVAKDGKVLAAEGGGPAATVEVVKKVVEDMGGSKADEGIKKAEERAKEEGDKEMADTAGDVADTAEALDK
ncbi:thioredoxin peroxidase dot5 [Coniosporium apollinis]|uniref:thioredoxin-dependent peroxiredoxin n=1 Tax=Coniosporium apollinis TaxID=61459 RepID=A0ABQ9NJL0_9PEZI|nr:thioredoxin peroxidase dot5 [Coniosporium apollinis]